MPPRKKTTTVTEEIPESPEVNLSEKPIVYLSDDPLAEVDRLFPNSNRKFKVSRSTPTGLVHVFSTTEIFDEDFLQENYGGGKYVIRLYIDGVKEREYEMRVEEKRSSANPGATIPEREKIVDAPPTRESFLEAMMMKFLTNMQPQQSTTSVSELASALQAVHSITGGNQNGGKDAVGYMEGVKAGIELAKGITSENSGDWKAMLFDTLKTVVPQVTGAIQNYKPNPPVVPAATPFQTIQKGETKVLDVDEQRIYNVIQQLKQQCLNRTPVTLVVDWAIANASMVDVQNVIRATFTRDFAAFAAIDPEIGNEPFATWFKTLYDELRTAFVEPNDMEDDHGGEHGDDGNVSDHDAVGERGSTIKIDKKSSVTIQR